MRQSHKTILLWLLLILMFVSIYSMFTGPSKAADEKIAFGAFMQEVQNNPAAHQEGHDQGRALDGRVHTTVTSSAPSARRP